jgi:hypothetical protein
MCTEGVVGCEHHFVIVSPSPAKGPKSQPLVSHDHSDTINGGAGTDVCSDGPRALAIGEHGRSPRAVRKGFAGEPLVPPLFAPGRIRTSDLALRRRALYPLSYGRGDAGSVLAAQRLGWERWR